MYIHEHYIYTHKHTVRCISLAPCYITCLCMTNENTQNTANVQRAALEYPLRNLENDLVVRQHFDFKPGYPNILCVLYCIYM